MEAALARQQALGIRTIADSGTGYTDVQSRGILNTTTVDVSKRFVLKNIFSYRENSGSFANDLDGTPLTLLLMNPSRMAGCLRYTTAGPTYTGFARNRSASIGCHEHVRQGGIHRIM